MASPRLIQLRKRVGTGALTILTAVAFLAAPDTPGGVVPVIASASAAGPAPLRFGVYPGGPLGTVGPKAQPAPENAPKRLAAIQALRGDAPFVVHLYRSYVSGGASQAEDPGLDGEIEQYTAAGLGVEIVACFRASAADSATAVAGYREYVRALVDRYGQTPGVVALQVTNEANVGGQGDASDGAYAGVRDALVAGVIGAKERARATGTQLAIGFNWAFDANTTSGQSFWRDLAARGGQAFAGSVDWVGLDSYPGTWAPSIPLDADLPALAAAALLDSVRALRTTWMPVAGLGAGVPIHVSENGWPTGPGRPAGTQAEVLSAMVQAVSGSRAALNITDYRWFDLRDSLTSSDSFESHYGLTTDDYSPKPAFAAYRDAIATLGGSEAPVAPGTVSTPLASATSRPAVDAPAAGAPQTPVDAPAAGAPQTQCSRLPLQLRVPSRKGRRIVAVVLRLNGKRLLTVRGKAAARTLRVHRAKQGRAELVLRVTARRKGRSVVQTLRRSIRVCTPATRLTV